MTRMKARLERHLRRSSEEGQALILAIVFLLVFALMLTALLSGVSVNLNMTAVTKDQSQLQYAADAGVEWGINQIKQSGTCNSSSPIGNTSYFPVGTDPNGKAPFPIPAGSSSTGGNVALNVYCQPRQGLGTGTFGGYDVVTGMNYPNVPGYPTANTAYQSQENAGSNLCTSFSGDPVGHGKATYATLTGTNSPPLCLNYPLNPWSDSDFNPEGATGTQVTPGAINQLYAVGASDIYAVGPTATAGQSQTGSGGITSSGPGTFTISSPSLFTASNPSFVNWQISDSQLDIPANSIVGSESTANHTVTLKMGKPSKASTNGETFTLTLATTSSGIYHYDGSDDFDYIGANASPVVAYNGVWAAQGTSSPVWVVGNGGAIQYCPSGCSTWETATWTQQAPGLTGQNLTAVTCIGSNALWAVGAAGTLLSFDGTNWHLGSLGSTTSGGGAVTGANPNWMVTSTTLFTASNPNFQNWTIKDSAGAIPNNTIITGENTATNTVTLSKMPTKDAGVGELFTLTPPTPSFASVTLDSAQNLWAAGTVGSGGTAAGVIYECQNPCSTSTPSWTPVAVPSAPTTYSSITASGSSVWAVGVTNVSACLSNCQISANWQTYAPTNAGNLTGIAVADASDVWMVSSNATSNGVATPIMFCSTGCNAPGASWQTTSVNETEGTLKSVTAVPANLRNDQTTWADSVWVAGTIPAANQGTGWATFTPSGQTTNVLLDMKGGSVLNGGALNAATPMSINNGSFTQYASSCSGYSLPSGVTISGGTPSCTSAVPAALNAVDEPLPSEAAGNFFSCLVSTINPCNDMSGNAVTIHPTGPFSAGCTSLTEFFPGYYKSAPKLNLAAGATNYFASGVYYFSGGGIPGSGPPGPGGAWGALDSNIANPAFIVGGQPASGDAPTVAVNSPCWNYIKNDGQVLDSGTGWPSGSWFEGGGATSTPNGTGVDWIFGGGTWLDVHTIDMELFTRAVPDATNPSVSAQNLANQIVSEGSQGLSMREIPPSCPSGAPAAGSDGAVHPGPFCVTGSSKWNPLNPGGNNFQALQIDANDHNPFVYIHGAIYMPDNNITLFTNQPQRDVWVGALDLNSLELTYDSQGSPPIQIIAGGSPTVSQVELIAQAQDPNSSSTTVWEEAVVNEPLAGSPPSTLPTIQSWRYCNGGSSLGGAAPAVGDFVKACQS